MTEKDVNQPNDTGCNRKSAEVSTSFMESQFNSHYFMTEKQSDTANLRKKLALNTSHADFNL